MEGLAKTMPGFLGIESARKSAVAHIEKQEKLFFQFRTVGQLLALNTALTRAYLDDKSLTLMYVGCLCSNSILSVLHVAGISFEKV
jgi:hypothetical protein